MEKEYSIYNHKKNADQKVHCRESRPHTFQSHVSSKL